MLLERTLALKLFSQERNPLAMTRFHLGTFAVLALVGLRLAIGWHFFNEGVSKIKQGNFSSSGFLSSAKGPLGEQFRQFAYDDDGLFRLCYAKDKDGTIGINSGATRNTWKEHRTAVIEYYKFDKDQQRLALASQKLREKQLQWFLDTNRADLIQYFRGLDRSKKQAADDSMMEVESLAGQAAKLKNELKKTKGPWLAQVDSIWAAYENDLAELVSDEQQGRGRVTLMKPSYGPPIDSRHVDAFIPYFDLTIGALLLVGLLTRTASVLGAGFLATVVATQWPGAVGTIPTYYQSIEMVGLLVLAGVGAGRFLGLDFYLHAIRMRCCPPSTGTDK